jgi:hypothetical protein
MILMEEHKRRRPGLAEVGGGSIMGHIEHDGVKHQIPIVGGGEPVVGGEHPIGGAGKGTVSGVGGGGIIGAFKKRGKRHGISSVGRNEAEA